MNIDFTLSAASLMMLHPDNSSYPVGELVLSTTKFNLRMQEDQMKMTVKIKDFQAFDLH